MPDGLIFLALAVGIPLAAIAQHEYAARRRRREALRDMRTIPAGTYNARLAIGNPSGVVEAWSIVGETADGVWVSEAYGDTSEAER